MSRNLKAAGLALVALLAMSAIAASAAQATTVTAEKYPVTLTGSQEGAPAVLQVGAIRSVQCVKAELDSTLSGPTAAPTVTAAYSECTSNPSNLPATVQMNTCDYTLAPNTPDATGKTGTGTATVDCTAVGDSIHVSVYKSAVHTTANIACTYSVSPQGPLPAGEYHNIGTTTTSEITLTLNVTGITVKVVKGTAILCGAAAGTHATATLKGNAIVTGEQNGVHVGIMVGH